MLRKLTRLGAPASPGILQSPRLTLTSSPLNDSIHKRQISIRETKRRQRLLDILHEPKVVQFEEIDQNNLKTERALNSLRISIKNEDFVTARTVYRQLNLEDIPTEDGMAYLELMVTYFKTNTDLALVRELDDLSRKLTLRKEGHPSANVFHKLFVSYLRLQAGRMMESLMEFMIVNQIPVGFDIIKIMMAHYAREGPALSAAKLMEYMVESGMETTPQHYYSLIDAFGRSGKPWEAMQVIPQAESQGHELDANMITRLLHCFATNGETKGMNAIWRIIDEKNFEKTTEMYNILIDGYKKRGDYDKAISIYNEMKTIGGDIKPDHYTISNIIDIHCLRGQAAQAGKFLEDMVAAGLPIRPHYINTVMDAYRKMNDSSPVLKYFNLFEEIGLDPDNTSFNILMSMYGFEHDLASVEKTLETMKGKDIPLTRFTIGLLMRIYYENGHYDKVLEWYGILKQRGMFPNSQMLSTMIRRSMMLNESLDQSLFYYDLASKLKMINQQLCNEFAVAHLLNGFNLESTIALTMAEFEKHSLKPNSKTLWIFVDFIVRPNSLRNHLRPYGTALPEVENFTTLTQGRKKLVTLFEAVRGFSASVPVNLRRDYEIALSRLK